MEIVAAQMIENRMQIRKTAYRANCKPLTETLTG